LGFSTHHLISPKRTLSSREGAASDEQDSGVGGLVKEGISQGHPAGEARLTGEVQSCRGMAFSMLVLFLNIPFVI